MLKMAGIQPAQSLGHGLLCRLLQLAGQAVAVHVDLAHIAGDAGALQLVHEDEGSVGVEGREHTDAGSAVGDQVCSQPTVDTAGVVQISEPRLGGERVGVEPVQQRQIHAHAQHGVLGRMEMHIREGLHDEAVAEVAHLGDLRALGQLRVQTGDNAVLQHQAAVLENVQAAHGGRVDDIAA